MAGMKAKTIKVVLRKKIKEWLDSIEHEDLKREMHRDVVVTGGAITSMLLGEKPNDYDFYLKTYQTTMRAAVYYATVFNKNNEIVTIGAKPYKVMVKTKNIANIRGEEERRIIFHMQSAGVAIEDQNAYQYFETQSEGETLEFTESIAEVSYDDLVSEPDRIIEELNQSLKVSGKDEADRKPYRPIFITDNAVSLANRVQLITRFYGEPARLHTNFDFVHAMCYYDYKDDKLVLPAESLESILSKALIYKGSLYPIASIFRIRKFLNRGWRISAGQLLKIVWQISELDLKNKDLLREQLIGVDVAYMHQLISDLQNMKAHEKIDGTYVAALVDKIFDE